MKATDQLVRRLPRFSEDLDQWIASLSPDDTILTPFGCGSDKLIYAAQQTGTIVKCCLPKRVKGCETDAVFFQSLSSLTEPDWYTLQPVDAERMRIKILAGVRLAIQKQRIQTGNRYGSYAADLELLAGNPIGRTFKQWSDVMQQLHDGFNVVESEVTKSLAKAVKNDPVYVKLLEPTRGIGPAIGGYLIGSILRPDRFPGIRSLWHYAGLHVEEDADGNGHAAKRQRGSCDSWNPNLKRLCCGIIPDVWQKLGGEYRDIQEERKAYEFARKPDMSKGQAHRRAWRYAVKVFLKRFWNGWRELDDPNQQTKHPENTGESHAKDGQTSRQPPAPEDGKHPQEPSTATRNADLR